MAANVGVFDGDWGCVSQGEEGVRRRCVMEGTTGR